MCSSTQPKMFGGAPPLGTGGSTPLSTVYQANKQPTADVGFTPPPPPTPVNASPGVTASSNPNSPKPIGSPYQKWGTLMGGGMWGGNPPRMGGGMNPFGGRMGTLPTMTPGGGRQGY